MTILYTSLTYSFLAGFIYSFSYPNMFFNFPLMPLFAPLGLCLFFKQIEFKNTRIDLLNILSFSFAIALFGFYWIPQTIQTFSGLPKVISYLLYTIFTPLILPHLWLSYFVVKVLKKKVALKPIFLAIIFSLSEIFSPSQFPVHVGQSWMQWRYFLGFAPIFGLPAYSFINYYIAFCAQTFFQSKREFNKAHFFNILTFIAFSFGFSFLTLQEKSLTTPSKKENSLKVRFVQANIGSFMKIQSELGQYTSHQEVYQRYRNLSLKNMNDQDLIIWPETAFPDDIDSYRLTQDSSELPSYLQEIARTAQAELILGAYDKGQLEKSNNDFQTVYNSVLHISNQAKFLNIYHKKNLIPFGETLPFGSLNKYLKPYAQGVSFFSQGSLNTIFKTKNKFHFISPICYEILQPMLIRNLLNHSSSLDFILNMTNDSWYGRTAEPYQHLYLSKWRAVEFQKPILRSTNSGITSVIDIDGTESKRLELGEIQSLDVLLNMPERYSTLYQLWGNLGLMLLFSLTFLNFLLWRKVF